MVEARRITMMGIDIAMLWLVGDGLDARALRGRRSWRSSMVPPRSDLTGHRCQVFTMVNGVSLRCSSVRLGQSFTGGEDEARGTLLLRGYCSPKLQL